MSFICPAAPAKTGAPIDTRIIYHTQLNAGYPGSLSTFIASCIASCVAVVRERSNRTTAIDREGDGQMMMFDINSCCVHGSWAKW